MEERLLHAEDAQDDLCTQHEAGRVDSLRGHTAFQGMSRGSQSWKASMEPELLLLIGQEAGGVPHGQPQTLQSPRLHPKPHRGRLGAEPLSHSQSVCKHGVERRKPQTPSPVPMCAQVSVPLYKFTKYCRWLAQG